MTEQTSWQCRSCGIRYALGAPIYPENAPSQLDIGGSPKFKRLREMAAEFDRLTAELEPDGHFTAQDFMDFIEPSILGTDRHRATLSLIHEPSSLVKVPA